MELHRLTQHCWYSDSDPDTDRPSLGYILGSEGRALVVDCGNSPKHYDEFLSLLKSNGLPTPECCILTHHHWDHVLGMSAVTVPVLACSITQKHLREMAGWNEAEKKTFYDGNEYAQAEYASASDITTRVADIVFCDEIHFDLGDIQVIARHIDGPHSDDSVIVYIPSDGMIFAGDSSAGDFSTPDIAYDPVLLEKYTESILSMDFNCFLHSHRQPLDRRGTEDFLNTAKQRGYYTFD